MSKNGDKEENSKELNSFQKAHIEGSFDVYKPIEAYVEQWNSVYDESGSFVSASPIPNTKVRQDLPSLAEQWKSDFKSRRSKK